MKITEAKIANYRGLKLVEMTPTNTLVRILGGNGAGKSSVLDALLHLLAGVKPEGEIVHHGAERAEVSVKLDAGDATLHVRMAVRPGGQAALKVERISGPDGEEVAELKSPRALLEGMFGELQDLRGVIQAGDAKAEREMRDRLLAAAKVDIRDLVQAEGDAYTERTIVAGALRRAIAQRDALPVPTPDLPAEPISVAAAAAEIAAWREQIQARRAAVLEQQRIAERMATEQARVARLERELEAARELLGQVTAALASHTIPEAPTEADVAAATERMAGIEATNRRIADAAKWRDLAAEVATLDGEQAALTERIEAARAAKVERLAGAKFPVEGLAVDEDGATYHGERVANLSSGQRIVVAAALAIATRRKLDALFFDGAESLDQASLDALAAMCEQHGVTAFVCETTRTGGELWIEGAQVSDMQTDRHPATPGIAAGSE